MNIEEQIKEILQRHLVFPDDRHLKQGYVEDSALIKELTNLLQAEKEQYYEQGAMEANLIIQSALFNSNWQKHQPELNRFIANVYEKFIEQFKKESV